MADITVLIADAQRMFSEALAAALSDEPGLAVMSEHPTQGLKVVEVVLDTRPDVTLVDYWIQGMEGPAATRTILARLPRQKIMITSWFHSADHAEKALQAGALAFLPKTLRVADVAEAVRRAHIMDFAASPHTEGTKFGRSGGWIFDDAEPAWQRLITLTPRELEILSALKVHGSSERVAVELSISSGTLRVHIHNILQKLQVRSRVEAIGIASRYRLI